MKPAFSTTSHVELRRTSRRRAFSPQRRQRLSKSRPLSKPAMLISADERAAYALRAREALSANTVDANDALWSLMQVEAHQVAEEEPFLASFLFSTILNHGSLHAALAVHLADKLSSSTMPSTLLVRLFNDVLERDDEIRAAVKEDLLAVMERDPTCRRLIDALLYYKGFHALQAHRIAHALWNHNRKVVAYHLQSQVSRELQVDIHPSARIGAGAFFDHATGVVIGENVTIGANCSMLQQVTIDGTGSKSSNKHPTIGDGVLIGAGSTIQGDVHVGDRVQLGASTLVLEHIPSDSTAVGVPARIIKREKAGVPSIDMRHQRCIECIKGVTHTQHSYLAPVA